MTKPACLMLAAASVASLAAASGPQTLTAADLEHGRQQVRQMLDDRPAMARYGDEGGVPFRWAVRKFAGEDLGQPILWNSADPSPGFSAQHCWPTAESRGSIRIRGKYEDGPHRGRPRTPEEMWSNAVFELYNILGVSDFRRIDGDVAAGKLSKREFVLGMAEVECRAAERTRAFYVRVFLPWAAQHRLATDPRLWHAAEEPAARGSPALFLATKDTSYRRYYEQMYDRIVLDSLLKSQQSEEAIKLASAMVERAVPAERRARVYDCRGWAYAQQRDFDKAVVDFSEAIRLDPKDARARALRGWVYTEKNDYDRAILDYSEAIRLNPKDAWAYGNRGWLYQQKGETAKATADFAAAARIERKRGQ